MCITPCQTCTAETFYSCQSCLSSSETLTGTLCLGTPTFYYQIVTTCLVFLLIIPVLLRKRCLTMVRILDYIQIAAYFKLIRGYTPYRHIWLYLGMRAWSNWSEGWSVIGGDISPPIWTVEEGIINKSIRVAATWGCFAVILLILGALKVALDQKQMTLQKYLSKNVGNYISYAYYFTLQDISFIIAIPILNPDFSTTFSIICFALAIFFAVLTALFMVWCFYRINFENSEEKYYYYNYLFLFSPDYDIFPTYDLLDLPKRSKMTKKYSNIRLFDMVKKLVYAFLITLYLSPSYESSQLIPTDQLFQIVALIVFFELIWLVFLPYNVRREFLQFILAFLGLALTVFLLFGPWILAQEIIHTAIVLALFGVAFVSIVIEFCFDMYKLVPVDLYGTGIKIVIEDHRLLKEIAMRRREQEEIMKSLKDMEAQNEKLKKEMQQRQKQKLQQNKNNVSQQKIPTNVNIRQDSQVSLAEHNNVLKTKSDLHQPQNYSPQQNGELPEERDSMNSEDAAELYKVDELKRRKVYQWNKQQPFVYSNKME